MNFLRKKIVFMVMVAVTLITVGIASTAAEEIRDMGGWGADDAYNKLYDTSEFEKIRAWVKRVKTIVPMPGMSPGVALDVYEGSESFEVHVAPVWFVKPGDIGIKPGDRVKLKGVWAEINGKDVFLASKIKKGEYFEFKVRLTKNGKPFWTMTPAELAMERASQ